jgi:hypothetical protein
MFSEVLSLYQTAAKMIEGLILGPFWQFVKNWWWFFLPFFLKDYFLKFWLWWRFEAFLAAKFNPILFEIKIPKYIKKPIRAMEDVMASLHAIVYHPPDWWEQWIEGQFQTSLGFEIASIEGEIHFYIRVHEGYVDAVKAAIYSQYPEVELTETEDYTKNVPQDIPNKDWDLWASNYTFLRKEEGSEALPILTYKSFEKEIEADEEKIVDPVAALLEALSEIGPGEQLWIQIGATPLSEEKGTAKCDWIKKGLALRDKLAKREGLPQIHRRPMVLDAADILVSGKPPEEPKIPEPVGVIPPELRLTPGERDIVAALEAKISKQGFNTNIRFIYLGKRNVFKKAKLRLPFTFFGSFYTHNLNALIPHGPTLTKIHKEWFLPINLLRPRRMYLRQRKIFRNYCSRLSPYFPRDPKETKIVLNTEELASIFHFPSWRVAPVPGVSRIEARKKAPPGLPKE